MCLIALAVDPAQDLSLVIAANRDEFFPRPTEEARWWPELPSLLAGRDLEAGGTWLGITRGGRIAALTNYRDPSRKLRSDHARSRGELVTGFLAGDTPAEPWLARLDGATYRPFSLLAGSAKGLWWTSPIVGEVSRVPRGVHALSNQLLDTPWPKVVRIREALAQTLVSPREDLEDALLAALADRTPAPDDAHPDTGVDAVLERGLSPIFVSLPGYGTRCSTVITVTPDGRVAFVERSFDTLGEVTGEVREAFTISG